MILRPTRFDAVALTLLDLGALRGLTELRLAEADGRPMNTYLIMGPNGAGKTTVLDSLYTAMRLLEAREHAAYGMDGLEKGGGVQLDALVTLDDGARARSYLLSIVAGEPGLLRRWKDSELEAAHVDRQIVLTFGRRGGSESPVERTAGSDSEALAFADAILERLGDAPQSLFETANGYPTVLYFPSDRGIRRPPESGRAISRPGNLGYRPAQRFDADGLSWSESLDNLFVWFAWLDDGREAICRDVVNSLIFRQGKRLATVDRQALSVPVEIEDQRHRLDQLSSGERQLVQLVVRIASHMTGSTIVLIDETEQHLHLVMRRRLVNIIKTWAREHEGLRFVLTSHQGETLRLLAPKLEEQGLVKGGCLIKPKFRQRT